MPKLKVAIGGVLWTTLPLSMAYGAAQNPSPTLTTIYRFSGSPSDGNEPQAGVVIGSDGVLYGTTRGGGSGTCYIGCGTVFSLTPPASHGSSWTETVLHDFKGPDGAQPVASVAIGSGGVLFGTTYSGPSGEGYGTVFSLTPPVITGSAWTETVLHAFAGGSDGLGPRASVAIGADGVLYGTTNIGGTSGYGTVFSLAPPPWLGGAWTETVLHSFAGAPGDGAFPDAAGVTIGSGGVLYGTTQHGGSNDAGAVFSVTPPAVPGGMWTETLLYSFSDSPFVADGFYPDAGVVIGSGGVLYGTTGSGGTDIHATYGTVFSLTPPVSPGTSWIETIVHNFRGGSGGAFPEVGVVIGRQGGLYGATGGGAGNEGTLFLLVPPESPGGPWTEKILYQFPSDVSEGVP